MNTKVSALLVASCGALGLVGCGDDAEGTADETSTTTGNGDTTVTTTNGSVTVGDTTVETTDATTTGGTTTDATTGTTEGTTAAEDSTTAGTTGTTGTDDGTASEESTGTGGPPSGDLYGDCVNDLDACDEVAGEECLSSVDTATGVCAQEGCVTEADCSAPPPGGTALAQCSDITQEGVNHCTLDCSNGETCPTGMGCEFNLLCVWDFVPQACDEQDMGNDLPDTATGTTVGGVNSTSGSCGGLFAQDAELLWTAPLAGTYVIDTIGSAFDTVLYVTEGAACGGDELVCNDDIILDEEIQSSVTVILAAGESIVIHVDGYGGAAVGNYTVNINAPD